LGRACLDFCKMHSDVIVIYANPLAIAGYSFFKFNQLYNVKRYRLSGDNTIPFSGKFTIEQVSPSDIQVLGQLNEKCYLGNRTLLMEHFCRDYNASIYSIKDGAEIIGYVAIREENSLLIIGPLIAFLEIAVIDLLSYVTYILKNKNIIFDAPENIFNTLITKYNLPFKEEPVVVKKMFWSKKNVLEKDDCLYVIGGHHFS
jgi:hypothetical protein